MLRSARSAAAAIALSSIVLLAGCAAPIDTSGAVRIDEEVPTTVGADDLATTAEDIVFGQGFDVDIDCGTEEVPLVVGTAVECSGFDEASETSGGYTVTITSVDGANYGIDVVGSEVAPSAGPGAEPEPALEAAAAFAGLTAEAITDALGEAPTVDCGTADIEIFEGQEVRCSYTTSDETGFVVVTVDSFDGSFYEISVVEG